MNKTAYAQLLRHPKWQRKRLEVMQAADFKCQRCGDDDTTLNVHHTTYRNGAMPWEYQNNELECLCEPCHEQEHDVYEPTTCPSKSDPLESASEQLCQWLITYPHMIEFVRPMVLAVAVHPKYSPTVNSLCENGQSHAAFDNELLTFAAVQKRIDREYGNTPAEVVTRLKWVVMWLAKHEVETQRRNAQEPILKRLRSGGLSHDDAAELLRQLQCPRG